MMQQCPILFQCAAPSTPLPVICGIACLGLQQFRDKMDMAMDQMQYQRFPEELTREIMDYYKHLWRTQGVMGFEQDGHFLHEVPEELQGRLLYVINYNILKKVWPIRDGYAGVVLSLFTVAVSCSKCRLCPRPHFFPGAARLGMSSGQTNLHSRLSCGGGSAPTSCIMSRTCATALASPINSGTKQDINSWRAICLCLCAPALGGRNCTSTLEWRSEQSPLLCAILHAEAVESPRFCLCAPAQ